MPARLTPEQQEASRERKRANALQRYHEVLAPAQRATQAHPCPQCGQTAYLTGRGRFSGLCQPCASRLGAFGRASSKYFTPGWGAANTKGFTPAELADLLTFDEVQDELRTLQNDGLPRLTDRLRRNRALDGEFFTSFGKD